MHDVDTNNTPGGAPEPTRSRRSFLAGALGASALAVPALALVSAGRAGAADPKNTKKLTGLTATSTVSTSPRPRRLRKSKPPPNNQISFPGSARRAARVSFGFLATMVTPG